MTRNGTYTVGPMSDVHNNHLYRGEENPITVARTYHTNFLCDYDMALYPFDIQECNMSFVLEVQRSPPRAN